MKFTLAWLRTHLDTDAPLPRIAKTLSAIGLEVESIENKAATLTPFRIARVIEAVQHPNADRLRVCTVDTGNGTATVVCGAPNARTGMKAVFAAPGTHIPGTDMLLKVGEIRGVQSAGMLLSAREMGLGEDHSGIIDLPEDAPVGAVYAEWAGLDDPLIEIGVTPNRGDAFSVRGVARDLAAAGIGELRPWNAAPVPSTFRSPLQWQVEWPEACPWVLGRCFRNLRNGPSPKWLADRLTAIGLRPINALVDVTNFFTVDLGRPLHVFDVGKLGGDRLIMRRGAGERFRALDGRDYVLTPDDLAIVDATGVQSLAGVMGGEASGCDEQTTTTFLECALFDPVRVALTGRRHQIASDARQRFERGIDPALMPDAVEAATRVILDLCGGEASEVVSAGSEPRWQRQASLRFVRLKDFGGVDIGPDSAVQTLERLGFTVAARDERQVTVQVPSWRNDICAVGSLDMARDLPPEQQAAAREGFAAIEPEADLIEEVLRIHGLDTIPPVSLPRLAAVPVPTLTPRQSRAALARRVLAAQGLTECVTFSFTAARNAALFGTAGEQLRLLNPIAADLDQLRPTAIATLVEVAQRNATRGYPDCALFEIGPAFSGTEPAAQRPAAAALRSGATPRSWIAPPRPWDALDVKSDAMAVLAALGLPMDSLSVTVDAPTFYHPGRAGVIRQGPKLVLATFGELHPRVLAALDLPSSACALEVFLDAIPEPKRRRRAAPDLPALQPVRRDFAFLVDADVPAGAVLRATRGADRALIIGATLFDVYAGPELGGKKSLAVDVTFQPRDHTLTEPELEAACGNVVAAVAKATGATLRG